MLNDLYEVMEELTETPDEWGEPNFSQEQYYDPVKLSAENLDAFEAKKPDRKVCCVDGGNNKIFHSPTDSIHLLRIYFNIFKGKKRVENIDPFTVFLSSRFDGDKIIAELNPLNETIPIEKSRFVLDEKDLDEKKPTSAGHTIRKYLEWEALRYAVEEHLEEGDIAVRDGVLQTTVESEREYAERAYKKVEEVEAAMVGIAKTSSLMTTKNYPLIASVQAIARERGKKMWYYHPIAKNSHPDHKGDMYIAKYHPSSDYAFRTEFYRDVEVNREEVLSHLAFQAKDPIFLGYPYGLVDADKKARVTDEEVEYLKSMGKNQMENSFKDKINTTNAHDRLSNI